MSHVYRVDLQGKPIVHGRTYWHKSGHIYQPDIHGVIEWRKDLLVYTFTPTNPDLAPLVVNFEAVTWDTHWTVLATYDYERAKNEDKKTITSRGLVPSEDAKRSGVYPTQMSLYQEGPVGESVDISIV